MPRRAPLKVYRTAIGFHDAYVAAPSRKAALQAWGAASDLFAIGSAEVVTDPALTREPLASPGKVVTRSRGSLEQHLTAAARSLKPTKRAKATANKPIRSPTPRPSRDDLAQAEAALATLRAEAEGETKRFDQREAELRRERKTAEDRLQKAIGKLERQVDLIRAKYEREIERWRAEA